MSHRGAYVPGCPEHISDIGLPNKMQPADDSQPAQEAEQRNDEEDSNSDTAVEDSDIDKAEEVRSSREIQEPNYDSGLDDEGDDKSIQTLTSSVCNGTFYRGRRYHSYSPREIYPLPDDKPQQDTQVIGHLLWHLTLVDGDHAINLWKDAPLFCAPRRQSIHKVLDIGTGTGLWAIDYAQRYPESAVKGIDLSYIQPNWKPANCEFEIDNLELDWPYFDEIDFIHCRNTLFRNPVQMIRSAYNALRLGGHLEFQQFDYQLRCIDDSWNGTYLKQWGDLLAKGTKKFGLDLGQNAKYLQQMEQQGFENVECKKFVWPTNTWAKHSSYKLLGMCFNEFLTSDLEGLSMLILGKGLGWMEDEVKVLCARVRNDLNDPCIHAYADVSVTYGSKS